MSINVRKAELSDMGIIEQIASLAFKKFELDKKGLKYEKNTTVNKMSTAIEHPDYRVFVCSNEDNVVVGFVFSIIHTTLYDDSTKQIIELGMQPDPRLSKSKQSKILLKLMKSIEDVAKKEDLGVVAFSICPEFDISSHLEKKGYRLSDKIFIKARSV
tara:strand:- start:890 stop:1363 length:474 start_codon:yes stop_codon:yes gene_type:complete